MMDFSTHHPVSQFSLSPSICSSHVKRVSKTYKMSVFFSFPNFTLPITFYQSSPFLSYPTNNIFLIISFSKASYIRLDLCHLPSLNDLLAAIGILYVGHGAPGKLESVGNFIVLSSLAASAFHLNAPLKI